MDDEKIINIWKYVEYVKNHILNLLYYIFIISIYFHDYFQNKSTPSGFLTLFDVSWNNLFKALLNKTTWRNFSVNGFKTKTLHVVVSYSYDDLL